MTKKRISNSIQFQFFEFVFVVLYLCIGFIPNWGAVDKVAPQWFVLSCINISSSVYVLFSYKKFRKAINSLLKNAIVLSYVFFFIWAAASFFYALNPTEVLVNIPRHANTLCMLLFLFIFLYQFQNAPKLIINLIVIILGIEVYSVLYQAFEMYQLAGDVNSGKLKGITANRNITAFSIAVKLPFLLLFNDYVKKILFKISAFFLFFFSVFSISIIASRASFIAVSFVVLGYIALQLINYFHKKREVLFKTGFIILPILLSLFFNQLIFSSKNNAANVVSRAATIKVDGSDNSINQRLRYYEDVLIHIQKSPFVGVGIGNWKIKSIDYDKNDIQGYVVPYHAHNDFIQIGAELGIIGFLLYLSIFISAVIMSYKLISLHSVGSNDKVLIFMLLLALGVYLIDANLNFPIARPQVLYTLTITLALIGITYAKNQNQNVNNTNRFGIGVPIISILILIPSLNITNITFKSLRAQMLILQDFNSNKYNLPLNQIESYIPSIPNITVTTIPMDAIKARYYLYYNQYDKALALAEKAKKANPYLRYPEILQSQIYAKKGKEEQAWEMSKIAFENLPRNTMHANQFINLSMKLGKREAIKEAFPLLILHDEINNWKNYLIAVSQLFPAGKEPFISQASLAVKRFPDNKEIKNLQQIITLGKQRINDARKYSQIGLNHYNTKDFIKAAMAFEKALKANPLDYAHFENAATANYLTGNLDKANDQIDVVIEDLNPLNGKCEYIKALILIRYGDNIGACSLLQTSIKSGYEQAKETQKQVCSK